MGKNSSGKVPLLRFGCIRACGPSCVVLSLLEMLAGGDFLQQREKPPTMSGFA